jgi:hypothetical protein
MADLMLPLDRAAVHVDVDPGGEIILRGSLRSMRDGSIVDAATTTWPDGAPGGGSVDVGGLVDLDAGGFHLVSRDPVAHVVHAIATGDAAPACAAAGVAAPCLPLRVLSQARSRLLMTNEWVSTLQGGIALEVTAPPTYAPAAAAASRMGPTAALLAGIVALAAVGAALARARKRRQRSPLGRLLDLGRKVQEELLRADPIVAAPLAPAVARAMKRLREARLDASSAEARRVEAVLERVRVRLADKRARVEQSEREAEADALVREVESALEAAEEIGLDVDRSAQV